MNDDTLDIDTSQITAASANRLRALFEGCARVSRRLGDEPAEGLLLCLAGLMDSLMKARAEQTGEPIPAPVSIDETASDVSLDALTARDCVALGTALVTAGERWESELNNPRVGGVLAQLADLVARAGAVKAQLAGGDSTIQSTLH